MERLSSWVEDQKQRYLKELEARLGVTLHLEGRRESRWARGPGGGIALLASREHPGPQWWFGLKADEFYRRGGLGVVFLCQTDEGVVDFGLPAARLTEVLNKVSREVRTGEHKFHIVRHDGRYVLRPDLDLTPFKGNVSWLRPPAGPGLSTAHNPRRTADPARESNSADWDSAFFARVREGALEPLDPTGLAEGELVLVRASIAGTVPGNAALRRILARGGPTGLPADLAERHDHYAREVQP